jgi:putative FmdB family regulatory protein
MPLYEYHCRSCKTTFELLRPMRDATSKATCPSGHAGATRVISLVAARAQGSDGAETPQFGGGGSCACGGGACGCGH